MQTSSGLEGRRGTPFTMLIEQGKVQEFSRATELQGSRPPATRSALSPVTFLSSSRFWCPASASAWEGVERDYRRVLHGAQEFVYPSGPVPIGTSLLGIETIDRSYEKTGRARTMGLTETVTRFSKSGSEEELATMRATSITLAEQSPPTKDDSPRDDWVPPPGLVLIEEVLDQPLTLTRFVRYQGASGDFNPIHHDSAFAAAAGYPAPLAIGMLAAGLAASLLQAHADMTRLRRYRVRWHAPAWPGDRLRFRLFTDQDPIRTAMVEVARECGQTHMVAAADLAEHVR